MMTLRWLRTSACCWPTWLPTVRTLSLSSPWQEGKESQSLVSNPCDFPLINSKQKWYPTDLIWLVGRDPESHHLLCSTAEEILPELESGGIKDLVRIIRGRFTSSLVNHGDTSIKLEHLCGTDPELHMMLFYYSLPVMGLNPISREKGS